MPTSLTETLLLVVQFMTPIGETETESLLAACTRAFDGGTCVEAGSTLPAEVFLASVESTAPDHVLLEMKVHSANQQLYSSREISFQPADGNLERARSLGLSLGILANTLREEQEAAREQADSEELKREVAKPPPPRKVQEPTPPPKKPQKTLLVGLGAGINLNPTWPGVGPSADLHAALFPKPWFFLLGRFSGAYQGGNNDEITLSHLAPSIGGGLNLPIHNMNLLFSVEGSAERITGYLPQNLRTDEMSGQVEKAGRWIPNVRAGFEFLVPLSENWRLSVSPAAIFNFTPLTFDIDGAAERSIGVLRFSLHAGVAWFG